ncbi:nuclear transport factor 2 family protein [Gordonia sihwensis]|uniref:nuclear transport factor 2 family protein n=1 Tax=Gordonia TaxID=2053 RepID=UPI002416C9BD|nr:nuclear transport factor 2 family protein [Gordonia sihwensis]WFN94327.1 nuclear transport factor 2 family protein [Gordonia sihwensis]
MTITTGTMTDEQRKSVALEFLKRVDTGGDVIELFADDALFCFPKYGMVRGVEKIEEFLGELGGIISSIEHHSAYFNYIVEGDRVVVEGTSHGTTATGVEWRAGLTYAGPWCDVFEIRDFKIHRLFVYLDPDYADADSARYPWLTR